VKLEIIEITAIQKNTQAFVVTDESGAVYGRYADKDEACARKADWEEYLNDSAESEQWTSVIGNSVWSCPKAACAMGPNPYGGGYRSPWTISLRKSGMTRHATFSGIPILAAGHQESCRFVVTARGKCANLRKKTYSMSIKRKLFEIWEDENPRIPELPWRVQTENYVCQFPTRAACEKWVKSAQEYRARMALAAQQERK
jgi:hypothetical protein